MPDAGGTGPERRELPARAQEDDGPHAPAEGGALTERLSAGTAMEPKGQLTGMGKRQSAAVRRERVGRQAREGRVIAQGADDLPGGYVHDDDGVPRGPACKGDVASAGQNDRRRGGVGAVAERA